MTNFWTTKIPHTATYAKSGIQPATAHAPDGVPMVMLDVEHIGDNPADPLRMMTVTDKNFPQEFLVHVPPDMEHDGSWNGCWSFIDSQGRIRQGQVLKLAKGGNPSSWYTERPVWPDEEFFHGGHGGSGLSVYAGSLRNGELTSSEPIAHKVKINLYGRRFLSQANHGFRWPADRADNTFREDRYPGKDGTSWFPKTNGDDNFYGASNPLMGMGTQLAIPRGKDLDAFGITEPRARKLGRCFKQYGAIIVDNAGENQHAICGERDSWVSDTKTVANRDFHIQVMKLFTMLRVTLP